MVQIVLLVALWHLVSIDFMFAGFHKCYDLVIVIVGNTAGFING